MKKTQAKGFTIIELLVVISIIALLISILLPAVGKARDNAKIAVSRSNLRQLGVAMHSYAADWQDRQFTPVRDTLSVYGSLGAYNDQVYGPPSGGGYGDAGTPARYQVHPPILWGYGSDGGLYAYPMDNAGYHWSLSPIGFPGGGGSEADYFGWFRFPLIKAMNVYLGG